MNRILSIVKPYTHVIVACLYNICLSYLLLFLARVLFYAINYSYFADLSGNELWAIWRGGLSFDTAAIGYLDSLYILLMLIPLHYKENKNYQLTAKIVFICFNGVGLIMNLADAVYFQYTNRRTTASIFSEFQHEQNVTDIIGIELIRHWYLVLIVACCIISLCKFYKTPRKSTIKAARLLPYYGIQTVALALGVFLCIIGIRGGIGHNVRPITISNASAYVSKPIDAALVLNTPFALIRTIGKKPFQVTRYFSDQNSLEQVFTPVHRPEIDSIDSTSFRPLNVVVFIMESFGQEYTDEGYTPFLDSLTNHALSFTQSFANGRKSIDAMPSILSSIPYMVEPFILTPASLNKLSGLADNLNHKGYYTAFFHGADNGSMGFDAFARATGFQRYYGRTEYNADPSFGGNADFDGQWAVWDEEFFQFFKKTLDTLPQPFATAMFSASSHHPFRIPEKYQGRFPEGTLPIHVPIAYSDYALRRFFEAAKQEAWYANTLFVITADHTNVQEKPENLNSVGLFRIPVVFYRPDNSLAARREGIAQQIDILPTVLGYLRYDRPYLAFGCDLLNTPSKDTFAFNYVNDIYQYIQNQYVIQFNGQEVTGLYDYIGDPLLKVNLKGTLPQVENEMESRLKAFIQQYMERMTEDRLTVE